ncbi:YncE family protein [Terriglobus sp. 2YAB30_2]|uniref:YncE family protein n=1 Tax=unclassified Terriglobus TaxID=2628988 RepID=UPI003F9724C5
MNIRIALLLLASFTPAVLAQHTAHPAAGANKASLTLVSQTYLPDIVGDFDHFTVDLKRNHLFLAAEVHHSVEVFDLTSGKHLQSIPGFKTPHSIAFAPEKDELMVCDGAASDLTLVSGETLEITNHIPLISGAATKFGDSPDAAFYDKKNRLYYIGNGGISAQMETSKISIFSVDEGKLIGDLDVPGNNVESIGVDTDHNRLYVNIRDKQQVGVYDLAAKKLISTWTAPGMAHNTALIVDSQNERIFTAGRAPGILYVFDRDGKAVSQLPTIEKNDDMNWDSVHKLLYVSGTQGLSIYHQDTPDTYTEVTRIPTNGGKTSILVPQVGLFFVAHPKTDVDVAGILVYRTNN